MFQSPMRSRRLSRTLRAGLSVGVLFALATCSDATGPGEPPELIEELPRPLSAAEEQVLAASNRFAFDVARELIPPPDSSLFFSPLSLSMALGMLLNGADGDTYAQMQSMLGLEGLSEEQINDGYLDLIDLLTTLDPSVTVELGNSVWADQGFPLLPDFVSRVQESFRAEVAELDFSDPATLDRINGWASDATNGLVDEILESMPPDLVLLLLNAIYFQGDWTDQFDESDTRSAPFRRPDGSEVDVDLMFQEVVTRAGSFEDASVVDLAYGGQAFSMTLVLPPDGTGAGELLAELDQSRWQTWLDGLVEAGVWLYLPRFELSWEGRLNGVLQALGMTDAFASTRADFSRLTPEPTWLDFVKQKAFIAVDEEGTEAAAVTSVGVVDSAPPTFRFDRPFLFVLRERLSGTILFMGVVNDPTT